MTINNLKVKLCLWLFDLHTHKRLPSIYLNLFFLVTARPIGMGRVAYSVTCLATDASLTADPGVTSSIPAWSHTFLEIDHEIILLPSTESFKYVR